MIGRPLGQFLANFDPRDASMSHGAVDDELACRPLSAEVSPQGIELAAAAARREGWEEGWSEGRAVALSEYENALADARQSFEQDVAAFRAEWATFEGQHLAKDFATALRDIESRIAGCVAGVLRGMLVEGRRHQAMVLIADEIRALVGGKERPVIEVSGAADLLAAFRDKMGSFAGAVEYVSNQSPEVRVVIDQTVIETRIDAWVERLKALSE